MTAKNIGAEDLRRLLKEEPDNLEIIDVREEREYAHLRVRGSRLIPLGELPQRVSEIDWSKEVVFLCRSGQRSRRVADMVAAAGGEVKNLQFGILDCLRSGTGEFLEGPGRVTSPFFA